MHKWFTRIPSIEAKAASLSVSVSIGLLIIKFAAYYMTRSAAVFSDAVESIANVLASTVALYALSVAHAPPDEEHPYGHGRIEFLSALFEGGMILMAAVFILLRTLDAMWSGELVQNQSLDAGLLLVTLALLVNGGVGLYLIRTGRARDSMTLEADGRHLMSDAWTSVAVLVALGLVRLTGWKYFDPIIALLIGGYIGWTAIMLLRRSGAMLMDRQDREDMELLKSILDAHIGPDAAEPRIDGYHKLRHRHSGRYHWVDFHVVVPAEWTLEHAHQVAEQIEDEIVRAMGQGDATAHMDPRLPGATQAKE